jgi:histone H3/H4
MPRNKQADTVSSSNSGTKRTKHDNNSKTSDSTQANKATKSIKKTKKSGGVPRPTTIRATGVKRDNFERFNSNSIFFKKDFVKIVKKCSPSGMRISARFIDEMINIIVEEQTKLIKEANRLRRHRGEKKTFQPSDYEEAIRVVNYNNNSHPASSKHEGEEVRN